MKSMKKKNITGLSLVATLDLRKETTLGQDSFNKKLSAENGVL